MIDGIKAIQDTINKLTEEKNNIQKQIAILEESISAIYEINNICKKCKGTRYTYDYSLIEGDPYGRSSDAKITCKKCNGTGRFHG